MGKGIKEEAKENQEDNKVAKDLLRREAGALLAHLTPGETPDWDTRLAWAYQIAGEAAAVQQGELTQLQGQVPRWGGYKAKFWVYYGTIYEPAVHKRFKDIAPMVLKPGASINAVNKEDRFQEEAVWSGFASMKEAKASLEHFTTLMQSFNNVTDPSDLSDLSQDSLYQQLQHCA